MKVDEPNEEEEEEEEKLSSGSDFGTSGGVESRSNLESKLE